ncbi:MAG: hypothetical protein AMXMBFR13_14900 [Phycisphaerae bacterium]
MSRRSVVKWLVGSLVAASVLGVSACSATPKRQSTAVTGDSDSGPKKKYKMKRLNRGGKPRWVRQQVD